MLGLWDPHTGTARVLGRMANGDYGLIAATAPPGGHAGLVATFPASCGIAPGFRCIRITDTATGSGVTVRSRRGTGSAPAARSRPTAAGSPPLSSPAPAAAAQGTSAQLSVVNTRTGRLRLVPGARYLTGAATLWAGAIPGREEILAAGPANASLVDALTLAERAVYFLPGDHRALDISGDVSYPAVVLG